VPPYTINALVIITFKELPATIRNGVSKFYIFLMFEHFVFKLSGRVTPKARPRVSGKKAYLPCNYRLWRNTALIELHGQSKPSIPLKSASIGIQFFGNHQGDLDNLAGSVLDALVEAKIILDDRLTVVNQLSISYIPFKETFCEIAINQA
jgi:Holliday junction resolvase RusA-like endonuclease